MEKEFCLACKKPNPVDREICECGGRNFVYGRDFSLILNPLTNETEIVCDCGGKEFSLKVSLGFTKYHERKYKCAKCNNVINIQENHESEYN